MPQDAVSPPVPPAPPPELDLGTVRLMFGTGAAVALASALLYLRWPAHLANSTRWSMVLSCAVLGAALLLATWRARRLPRRTTATAAGWLSCGVITLLTVALGDGVQGLLPGFYGLIVCMTTVLVGVRPGLGLAAACAATLLVLAAIEHAGGPAGVPGESLVLPLATHLLSLLTGASVGAIIARLTGRSLGALAEGLDRFAGLQRLAVDWYWELDEQFRFTQIRESTPGGSGIAPAQRLGRAPWEIADIGLDEEAMDALRADMESHRPFTGVLVQRRVPGAGLRCYSISGEPRFDGRGVFRGYWGVGRDTTHEARVRLHVAATETRYREVFDRSPSGLVLHRDGRILEANAAAARLFGFEDTQAMAGMELMALYAPGPSRQRAEERLRQLSGMPVGDGLPVTDYQMRSCDGRPLHVQATGVQVHSAQGGPATLSLYFDVTARLAAEAALQRSQAMLSHLFTTSPDCIAVIEMDSGRYAMVNASFARLSGQPASATAGRTLAEVGVWPSPQEHARLVAEVSRNGAAEDLPAVFIGAAGQPLAMLLSAARFDFDGRPYLVVNARDMTLTAETRLRHQAILQHASIGIAFTRGGVFLEANRHCERMFGWPQGGLIGQSEAVIWPGEREHDEIARQAGPLLAEGRPLEVERPLRRRDGSVFWGRLLAQAVDPALPSRGGTIWIIEDVTERRQVDQALATARDAAEAANRAKSAFLANTSHEIRTPLNGLLGLAQLARQPGLAPEQREHYLEQIHDCAQSLAGIISDILDLSKIEAGKIMLEALPFDLRETVGALHRSYAALAQAKGLTMTLTLDPALPATVVGDPVRTRQILGNFVTNALKFTEHGRIDIGVQRVGTQHVRLTVRDTGCGIDDATRQRLFTPFSQADESTTRRFGGTGLGLSICRQLARLMGGDVGVDSRVGVGSTFWAELSLPGAPAGADADPGAGDAAAPLRGARVLLVEDNPVNMMIAVALLERWGVEVAQASDGQRAIEMVDAADTAGRPFDAVLMDVQMPGISGHETARRIRQHHDAGRLPIIALTAAALVSEREQALAAGMNDFLTKPIDARRLRDTLLRFVRGRGA